MIFIKVKLRFMLVVYTFIVISFVCGCSSENVDPENKKVNQDHKHVENRTDSHSDDQTVKDWFLNDGTRKKTSEQTEPGWFPNCRNTDAWRRLTWTAAEPRAWRSTEK